MNEYLKSAFTNISSSWSNSSTDNDHSTSNTDNAFVGQTVELEGQKLRVERVIAEGGFGFVFKVRDVETQQIFALKRLIAADKESREDIENEIQVLIKLQPHPHVMKFISWGLINQNIFLLLSEFCGCGSLQNVSLPMKDFAQLNRICYQVGLAIQQMHRLKIIHRDLKIENILFDYKGFVKLCDFGSSHSQFYEPNIDWTPIQRSLVEDEMQRHTTPMYRPPEILDTYLHYPINTAMDIWAFGCLLFTIKYGRHPFEDSAKLRIINCKYTVPSDAIEDAHLQLIRSCLKVDPCERLSIDEIISTFETNFVDLTAACVTARQPTPTQLMDSASIPVQQPIPPGSAQPSGQQFGLSGFTRLIKDTSSKVMQSVSQTIVTKSDRVTNTETTRQPTRPAPPRSDSSGSEKPPPPRPNPPSLTVVLPPRSKSPVRRPMPSRPPPPPGASAPVESVATHADKPEPFFSNLDWKSEEKPETLVSNDGAAGKNQIVNDLLNLSVDDSSQSDLVTAGLDPLLTHNSFSGASVESSEKSIDLLGGSISSISKKSPSTNIDLLNDIFSNNVPGGDKHTTSKHIPIPTIYPSAPNSAPSSVPNNLHRNTSTPNLSAQQVDPLAQLGSFMSSSGATSKTTSKPPLVPPLQPLPTTTSNPASSIPRVASYNSFQAAPKQPDYSRSFFSDVTKPAINNSNGIGPKLAENHFEDLLQGFQKTPREPANVTLKTLKRTELINTMDPAKLKVMEWKENKTRNIRALLGSLDSIVWEECKWVSIGMHQLVEPSDVRKMYRKACLAVHPDKLVGSEHEELAKLIFVELNDAWSAFEKNNTL